MALKEDLEAEVAKIFRDQWATRDGQVVPEPADLKLGNDGVRLDATVLYADMVASTKLVDTETDTVAAEIYKAFLTCSARIIKYFGGVITAYDGDRIMAVYLGDYKNTSAAKTALKINYAIERIVRPKFAAQYPSKTYSPRHVVGIDTSSVLAARVGVRNDNDLVWVGPAANRAAKLCDIRKDNYASWITATVYKKLNDEAKVSSDGRDMWVKHDWTQMNDAEVYGSIWRWEL